MSPRTRHYGGDPSAHDKSHPNNRGDIRRPLGAPPPDSPGIKPNVGKGCGVLVFLALAAPVLAAVAARTLGS